MGTSTPPATYQCTPAARAALAVWARPGSTVPLPPDSSKNWEVAHADTWELVAISTTHAVARMRLRQGEVVEVTVEEGFLAQMLADQYVRTGPAVGTAASWNTSDPLSNLGGAGGVIVAERGEDALAIPPNRRSVPNNPALAQARVRFTGVLRLRVAAGYAPLSELVQAALAQAQTPSETAAQWLPPGRMAAPAQGSAQIGPLGAAAKMTKMQRAVAETELKKALHVAGIFAVASCAVLLFLGSDAYPLSIAWGLVSVLLFGIALRRWRRLRGRARQRA